MNPGAERRQFLVSIFSKRGSGEKKTYPEIDDGEFFFFRGPIERLQLPR